MEFLIILLEFAEKIICINYSYFLILLEYKKKYLNTLYVNML